jgi:hypothetical protein
LNDAVDGLAVRGGASDAAAVAAPKKGGFDLGLITYFGLWYLGNYYVSFFIANGM